MLKKKNLSRRFAALSLTGLLILCSGCGSAGKPPADGPEPSQALTTSSPAPSPTPGKTPPPSQESSPTDIDAPNARPSATDVSIQREAPDNLSFLAYKGAFTVTNAEDQTLSYDGKGASGTMELLEKADLVDAESREVFFARIPYSEHFTFQLTDSARDRQWGFDMADVHRTYFTVRADGKTKSFEYDAAGDLLVNADAGAGLDLTIGMPDSSLGERGWVRLLITSSGDEVRLESRGNTLYFSGLDYKSGTSVTLDYGGVFSGQSKVIELTSGSGALDLSGIDGGDITVTASKS